jgi:cell wall-associated NlpC family hydrolase
VSARHAWRAVDAALAELPGTAFERGARGPESFDCWGLVLEVRRRLGLPLPPDFVSGTLTRDEIRALFHGQRPHGWRRVEPSLGAIVLASDAGHAGVLLALRVVHAHVKAGVVAWSLGHWVATFGDLECWEARL